jgi:hydrogenase-4 component F
MELIKVVIAVPFIVAVAMRFVKDTKLAGKIVAGASWLQLLVILKLLWSILTGEVASFHITDEFIITRLDAAFITLTACVSAASMTHGYFFYQQETLREATKDHSPPTSFHIRLNYACAMFFVMAMFTVFTCKNLGFLWVCVESTTLISAPLVYFNRTKTAMEACWKYLIICSVGMSFALLGTLFIFAAGQHGAISGGTLETYRLIKIAPNLDYKLLRFGFIFCLLGYGTKAGMFPLHSWLPDAHSEAPAPSSALLSGSLLNCALFAIWRISEIVSAAPHAKLATEVTIWAGTMTVMAAALFLIRQHSLKRLFAFSSIENVGVMLVAIGLNSGPLFFLQALNHSFSKVALFLLSGNIAQGTGKKHIADQGGLMASAPGWAVLLALGTFAVTGAPPFGTFLSELLILMRAIDMHFYATTGLLMVGLALAFITVSMHIGRVFLGAASTQTKYFNPILTSAVPALLLACSLLLGLITVPTFWNGLD